MFDTWHHWRCGGQPGELRDLPPGALGAVQLSDAFEDVRATWTRPPTVERLLPGDGRQCLALAGAEQDGARQAHGAE